MADKKNHVATSLWLTSPIQATVGRGRGTIVPNLGGWGSRIRTVPPVSGQQVPRAKESFRRRGGGSWRKRERGRGRGRGGGFRAVKHRNPVDETAGELAQGCNQECTSAHASQ